MGVVSQKGLVSLMVASCLVVTGCSVSEGDLSYDQQRELANNRNSKENSSSTVQKPATPQETRKEMVSVTGFVKEYSGDGASHFLSMPDEILLIESNLIDLSAEDFLGQEVELSGVIIQKNNKDLLIVEKAQLVKADASDNQSEKDVIDGAGTEDKNQADAAAAVEDPVNNEIQEVEIDVTGYRNFESLPYDFKGLYPKNWYYSGKRGETDSVMHQYLFADQPLDETDPVIVLDIVAGEMPSGSRMQLGENKASIVSKGDELVLMVARKDGQFYRLTGPKSKKQVLVDIASSLEATK